MQQRKLYCFKGLVILYVLTAPNFLFAQTKGEGTSVGQQVQQQRKLDALPKQEQASVNSVLLHSDSTATLSAIKLYYTNDKKDIFDPQQGAGKNGYGLQAQSFKRLDSVSSIWGLAAYGQQRINDVRWNETSDWQWVYPYVLGDSVGGNQHQEYYHFKGGYNRAMGQYVVGLSAAYSAALAYRAIDPRMDNTSSDLTVGIAISRPVASYRLAFKYDYTYYTQHNTVKIASPISSPAFYHLIGMGVDQKLFWGKNTDNYYLGNKHTVGVQLQPLVETGFYLSIVYQSAYIDKSITNLRSLPVAHARTREGEVTTAYLFKRGTGTWVPALHGYYKERQGTSYLFEHESGNNYNKIGELDDFDQQQYRAQASIQVRYPLSSTIDWKLVPQIAVNHDKIAYVPQHRSMEWNQLHYGSSLSIIKQGGSTNLWDIQAEVYNRSTMDATLSLGQPLSSPSLEQLIRDQYTFYSHGYTQYGVQANYYMPLQHRLVGKIGLEMRAYHYYRGVQNQSIAIHLGLIL